MRPDVGTQPQFRKKRPPQTYRYDSSLAPALAWDGQNSAREVGEWLLAKIQEAAALPPPYVFPEPREFTSGDGRVAATVRNLQEAIEQLKRLGRPFLDWAGKAERMSFDVPTLPLFVHERLSTKAIVETLVGHRKDKQQDMFELFGDPRHSVTDQVLKAYEYQDKWVNRLILGDSLVVMSSLLHYEGLGGQVQMIYMDPPYGVRFGSNFQPFVRRRDVSHNDDEDMTREPEMVKAYRDTWELGLHSYLTYMRDRLLLSRELLKPSGSIFVQISDENLHHVREVLDEVFGANNLVAIIPFRKKTMPLGSRHLESVTDFLLWMARDVERLKFRPHYVPMSVEGDTHWNYVELPDGSRRKMTADEINNHRLLPPGSTPVQLVSLYPAGVNQSGLATFRFRGKDYRPPEGNSWFTNPEGMEQLAKANRIEPYEDGETLRYVLKLSDSPVSILTNLWADTSAPADKTYVVQTSTRVVQRCMLMATDPGDLVVDPTCGSGTTAYVAEHWGRRWIMIDTSRVPLALTRQRLLTATLPYYALKDDSRDPAAGFCYSRRQNRRGEDVGGIVPYVTKGSIAGDERAKEIVLFDRPDVDREIVRVTGPFTFEATIPTPLEWESEAGAESRGLDDDHGSFIDRMLEVLRKSPVFHVGGGKTLTLKNVRPPAKTLSLSAEAMVANGNGDKPVAFLFGPENGAISQMLVHEALREAHLKGYAHLYVVGFAIQPDARVLIDRAADMGMLPATYVQATPDLMMGDLLKNMRSSQIFSVCGLPEVRVRALKGQHKGDPARYEVELIGLDVFDPTTMKADHRAGDDVPAWFLDTDYNGLCFHVSQAFFPRTGAWNDLRRALGRDYDDSVWDHLAGTTSAPFEAGEHRQIAVKVIDDRGNELLVIKSLKDLGA
ncbi:MAG: site-specific DNA-methyltransferase [Candidatus Rokubacteria bacterium]|nr:site-specific DNA-methyltransferase [Candidatus Rokubacteria bacterium]